MNYIKASHMASTFQLQMGLDGCCSRYWIDATKEEPFIFLAMSGAIAVFKGVVISASKVI